MVDERPQRLQLAWFAWIAVLALGLMILLFGSQSDAPVLPYVSIGVGAIVGSAAIVALLASAASRRQLPVPSQPRMVRAGLLSCCGLVSIGFAFYGRNVVVLSIGILAGVVLIGVALDVARRG